MPTAYDTELLGRERETGALGHVLESAATSTGSGSALLLRGKAGIGKTALLDRTADLAHEKGFAVLRAVGSEAEAELAFGALHQVLWPLMERSEALPERQREALESALVLLDDLQWVDSSSAAVFAFLHRRIAGLPLVIISAGRPDDTVADGWRTRPLDIGRSRAVVGHLLRQEGISPLPMTTSFDFAPSPPGRVNPASGHVRRAGQVGPSRPPGLTHPDPGRRTRCPPGRP